MERKEFSIARFLSSKSRFDNIVLLEGFIVGILAGVVAVIYRLMLSYGEKIAYFVVDYIKHRRSVPGLRICHSGFSVKFFQIRKKNGIE